MAHSVDTYEILVADRRDHAAERNLSQTNVTLVIGGELRFAQNITTLARSEELRPARSNTNTHTRLPGWHT